MKWIWVFELFILQVNCSYLSLLKMFDMRNPVIVGTAKELKTNKMFDLMKNVMIQNQSICLMSNLRNGTFIKSPGIVLSQSIPISFYGLDYNLKKPWIIFGKWLELYSQINQPLYIVHNGSIWEQYEFKSFKKVKALATLTGKEFQWSKNVTKNFFERRGNFENQTLIGITHDFGTTNILPKEWKKMAKISNVVPNTYEVK